MNPIINLEELSKDDVSVAGGKGTSLGELLRADLPVPPGFTVTTEQCIEYQTGHELSDALKEDPSEAMAKAEAIKPEFRDVKEYEEAREFILEFFRILESPSDFKRQIADKARTK